MAEERDQVTPPVSPIAHDLPVATPMTSSEIDDVDAPRTAAAAGVGATARGLSGAGTGAPGSTTADADADPEILRQQIERTREDMSDTLNELQQRLSPQHIAEQAKASVREATVGRMQHLVGSAGETATQVAGRAQHAAGVAAEQVREHPIPVALAGAGAGLVWWLMRRSSSRQTWSNDDMYDWEDADMTYDRDYSPLEVRSDDDWSARSGWRMGTGWTRMLRENPIPASIAAASIGYMLWNRRSPRGTYDTVGVRSAYAYGDEGLHEPSTTERVADTARDVSRQAREKASAIGESVSDSVRAAQSRASEMSRHMSQRVQSARYRTYSQFDRWMHENPMAVGVAAMAAGAVVGLSVPRTRTEDHVMGASRDALIDKASDQAQQLKEQVREKVQSVTSELTREDEARPSSMTSSPSGSMTPGV